LEIIRVSIPVELKAKMKKYGIKPSEVTRKAWKEEIKRRELELEEVRESHLHSFQ